MWWPHGVVAESLDKPMAWTVRFFFGNWNLAWNFGR